MVCQSSQHPKSEKMLPGRNEAVTTGHPSLTSGIIKGGNSVDHPN